MNKIKDSSNRVVFLDYIRGIAAFLVVISHGFESFIPSFHPTQVSVLNIGMVGVVIFFMVSGFVIPFSLERYKSVKLFVNSRIFRIYPLYIIVFIITIILFRFDIGGQWILLKGKIIKNIVVHIFFLQDYLPRGNSGIFSLVGGAWTLLIEVIWYIIFAFLYAFKMNNNNRMIFIFSNIILLLLTLTSFFAHIRIPPGRYILLFYCFIGLFVYRFFNGELSKKSFIIILIVSFANIYLALFVGFDIYRSNAFTPGCVITSYSVAFLICILFYLVNNKVNKPIHRILNFAGKISYSLYLAHSIILLCLEKTGNYPIFSIISIVASIIFAYILYIYIEKPGVELGKKMAKRLVVKKEFLIIK